MAVPQQIRLSAFKKLEIRIQTRTHLSLAERDFTIFLNEKPVVCKSSLQIESGGDGFIFQASVELEKGQNVLFVEANAIGGPKARTPRIFVENDSNLAGAEWVWVNPNAVETGGSTTVCLENEMEISANLLTNRLVEKTEISMLINGEKRLPSARCQFKKGPNGYNFRDFVPMTGKGSEQKITLLFDKIESETVTIRHEPMKKPNCWVLSIGPKTSLEYSMPGQPNWACRTSPWNWWMGSRLPATATPTA